MGKINGRELKKIKKRYVLCLVEGENWEMGERRKVKIK